QKPLRAARQTYAPSPYATSTPAPTSSYSSPSYSRPSYSSPSYSTPQAPQPYGQTRQPYVAPPVRPLSSPVEAAPPPTDAQVVQAGRGRFLWPVRGDILSGFGPKAGGQRNDGLDIAASEGAPVHAAAAGEVVYAGDQVPGFGNLVLIKHQDGWVTAYAHLSKTEVKIKDHVGQGTEIGLAGETGGAVQPEVHFEIRYAPTPRDKARPVDPALLLNNP
ncbi:MAG TPA: M23 family metallopeptidase, partial [Caulobacteraceae bacterium]|nr:M23 family metallopeptidase [Caulobacteraceae bacterium]